MTDLPATSPPALSPSATFQSTASVGGGGSGGGSAHTVASVALSPAASRAVTALSDRSGKTLESDANVHFLRALYGALPNTTIHTDVLLQPQDGGTTRIRRLFPECRWLPHFVTARTRFIALTLDRGRTIEPPQRPSPIAGVALQFGGGAALPGTMDPPKYTSRNYDKLEVDCLAKVKLPLGFEWSRADAASAVYLIEAEEGRQALPVYPTAAAAAGDGSGSGMRRVSLTEKPAPGSPGPTATAHHYPHDATHYIVGEACCSWSATCASYVSRRAMQTHLWRASAGRCSSASFPPRCGRGWR